MAGVAPWVHSKLSYHGVRSSIYAQFIYQLEHQPACSKLLVSRWYNNWWLLCSSATCWWNYILTNGTSFSSMLLNSLPWADWQPLHFDHKTHFSNYVSYILGDLIPRRGHKSRKFAKMSKKEEFHYILPRLYLEILSLHANHEILWRKPYHFLCNTQKRK